MIACGIVVLSWLVVPQGVPETAPAKPGSQSRPASPADARMQIAINAFQLSDYKRAERELRAALQLEPNRFDAHLRLGIVLYKLQRWSEAIPSLDRAIELKPSIIADAQVLGHCYYELGKHEEALAAYDRVLAANPKNREALRGKGVTLERLGRYDEAEETLRKAVALNPDATPFLLPLGRVLVRKKQYGAALPYLEKAKTQDPFDWEVEYELARAYKALGNDTKAAAANERKEFLRVHQETIRSLKAKFLNDASDVPTIVQLALQYDIIGNVILAEQAWDRAIKLSRDDAAVASARAQSMVLTGNKAAAEKLLRDRIARGRSEAETWETLWWVLKERGDAKGAEEAAGHVRQLLKRDPAPPKMPKLEGAESAPASNPSDGR
jgi:tetratricopeptide (TPR) repeat protein